MTFQPDTFGVKTEEYPLSRRLFLYTPPLGGFAPQSAAAGLIEFALSLKAQPAVREAGFIDQELEQSNAQGVRVAHAQNLPPAPARTDHQASADPGAALPARHRRHRAHLDHAAVPRQFHRPRQQGA
jgi:hypothetical protein